MEEEEIRKREEMLVLEATERSLELERLETRERQVAQAKDAANAREARIQEEVDSRVAEARTGLDSRHDIKAELVGAGADGQSSILRSRLAEAEQREKVGAATQISV